MIRGEGSGRPGPAVRLALCRGRDDSRSRARPPVPHIGATVFRHGCRSSPATPAGGARHSDRTGAANDYRANDEWRASRIHPPRCHFRGHSRGSGSQHPLPLPPFASACLPEPVGPVAFRSHERQVHASPRVAITGRHHGLWPAMGRLAKSGDQTREVPRRESQWRKPCGQPFKSSASQFVPSPATPKPQCRVTKIRRLSR